MQKYNKTRMYYNSDLKPKKNNYQKEIKDLLDQDPATNNLATSEIQQRNTNHMNHTETTMSDEEPIVFPCFSCHKAFVFKKFVVTYVGHLHMCDDCKSKLPQNNNGIVLPPEFPPMTVPPPIITPPVEQIPENSSPTIAAPRKADLLTFAPSNPLTVLPMSPMLPMCSPMMNVNNMAMPLMIAPPMSWPQNNVPPIFGRYQNMNPKREATKYISILQGEDFIFPRAPGNPNAFNQYPDLFSQAEADFFFGSKNVAKYVNRKPCRNSHSKLMKLMNQNNFIVTDYSFEVRVDKNTQKVTIETIPNYRGSPAGAYSNETYLENQTDNLDSNSSNMDFESLITTDNENRIIKMFHDNMVLWLPKPAVYLPRY